MTHKGDGTQADHSDEPPEGANESATRSVGPRIRFGKHSISPAFEALEMVEELGTDAKARATFDASSLREGPIEYRGEAVIEHPNQDDPANPIPLFSGWVTSVALDAQSASVQMRSGPQLDEARLERFSHAAGISAAEVVWSIAQFAGYGPGQLRITGLQPIRETFDVVMPVHGLALEADTHAGPVLLTNERDRIESALAPLPDEEGKGMFLSSGVWAVLSTTATMLLEAERVGVATIEGQLDRLTLEAQYSLGAAPDGTVIPFDRVSLFADPTAETLVLVRGRTTPRSWLRSLRMPPFRPAVGARRLVLPTPPVGRDARFDEALRAWRRATRATDKIESATALWEAIEFYAAAANVPTMFSAEEIRSAKRALAALPLTPGQLDRLNDVVGSANSSPLMVRVQSALDADRVPYSRAELDVLRRLRKYRNDFTHGRARAEPSTDDLDLAKGIVNRMLAFRAART